jgi:hypothetical protein
MPFIGNQPALSYTSFAKQDFTTSATTSYTLDNPVANANELALFINFVRQEPTTAYSASGTSLTLTSATSATDDMYCVFLGKAVQTVNPPNGSVGTSQLASTAVTPAKMDLSQNYTFTGTVSGQNYPAFQAHLVASQNISNDTVTTGQYSIEGFDTDGCYDTGTYRFTPTTAGKYIIGLVQRTNNFNASRILGLIRKNGNTAIQLEMGSGGNYDTLDGSAIVTLNGSTDYVDCALYQNSGSTQTFQGGSGSEWGSLFFGYRIGS